MNLFTRSPHPEVVRAGLAILHGEPAESVSPAVMEEVRRVFFGPGPDLPRAKACNWRPGGTKSRPVADLIAILASGSDEG